MQPDCTPPVMMACIFFGALAVALIAHVTVGFFCSCPAGDCCCGLGLQG
jgi:hypothetical protein